VTVNAVVRCAVMVLRGNMAIASVVAVVVMVDVGGCIAGVVVGSICGYGTGCCCGYCRLW